MKTLNTQHSSLLSIICSSLLALVGFSSCSENEVMYGMPTGSFEIKGSVTDEDKQAVKDAEIRVTAPEIPSDNNSAISTITNSTGEYKISLTYFTELKVVCIPKEPDLKSDSVMINMDNKSKIVNFILKSKDSEDE